MVAFERETELIYALVAREGEDIDEEESSEEEDSGRFRARIRS